jgi:phosphoglycolate phosphatase-like HAD superfamily hydrolase
MLQRLVKWGFLEAGKMRVKAILFDLDGTIFDIGERDAFARYLALRDLGYAVSLDDVRKRYRYGLGSMGVFKELGIKLSEKQEKKCIEASFKHFTDRGYALKLTRMHVGAYDALSALSKSYRLGLVTSRNTLSSTEEELGWFNIREFFMLIVTREVAAKYFGVKSLPLLPFEEQRTKLYECAIGLIKMDPREMVCVGDAVGEIEPARKLGIRVIGVLTGFSSKEDMEKASIPTIKNLGELVEILAQSKG